MPELTVSPKTNIIQSSGVRIIHQIQSIVWVSGDHNGRMISQIWNLKKGQDKIAEKNDPGKAKCW